MIIKSTIIGLGNIGMLYDYKSNNIQTHAKAILTNKKYNLIGTVEKKKERRDFLFKKYKIKSFSKLNYSLILNSNLVVISTSTNQLFETIKMIIKINPNTNILIEKPFGLKKKEIDFIKKKFITKNKIYVNYYRNFDKSITTLKKIIIKKFKGSSYGNLYYTKGFFHNSCHFLAMFNYIFGKIKKVDVIKKTKIKNNDYFVKAIIYYKNFQLSIFPDRKSKFNSFNIFGLNANLFYKNDGSTVWYQNVNKNDKKNSKKIKIFSKISNYQKVVYDNIYKDLINKESLVFDYSKIIDLSSEVKKFNLKY